MCTLFFYINQFKQERVSSAYWPRVCHLPHMELRLERVTQAPVQTLSPIRPSSIESTSFFYLQMPDIWVQSFTHLKDMPRADTALELLKKTASLVKPIMRKHGWVLPVLAEFYPDNPSLLGVPPTFMYQAFTDRSFPLALLQDLVSISVSVLSSDFILIILRC